MTGRHRRRGTHAQIPQQRRPRPVGIVDARTRVEHLVPADVLTPPRLSYLAKCGIEVLAASMTDPGQRRCQECAVSPVGDLTSGRPLVKQSPPKVPGGRLAPPDVQRLASEVAALAELLAEVVQLAGRAAIFPGQWEALAEQAMEYESVRASLLAAQKDTP